MAIFHFPPYNNVKLTFPIKNNKTSEKIEVKNFHKVNKYSVYAFKNLAHTFIIFLASNKVLHIVQIVQIPTKLMAYNVSTKPIILF